MGNAYGSSAMSGGMLGWGIAGISLLLLLVIVWIIVGILLIIHLYRKVSKR